ncbi:hypothetical protein JXQ70_04855 [bacterium]|nr:hypothetical protein [bacterium]
MVDSPRKKIFIIHGKGRIGGEGEEVGGDLDTIASNTFYGVWCRGLYARDFQRSAVYGQDYEFDFVNYHEGLAHLSKHKGCDLYLPDFPLDAIPDLVGDVEFLAEHDAHLVRIDDHHPWTEAAREQLNSLVERGLLDTFYLEGPMKGEEIPKKQQVCGADIIHREFLLNTPFDNPGLAELRRLAHIQDLHIEFDNLALKLSKLIASGYPKVDMVLRLMEISCFEDIQNILISTGWDKRIKTYERLLSQAVPKLDENLVLLAFYKPVSTSTLDQTAQIQFMKERLGWLRFLLPFTNLIKNDSQRFSYIRWLYALRRNNVIRIVMALAPYRAEHEARINVAGAIEYVVTKVTMDYFFYCYGSFIMTTRNVNDPERWLDLSLLMPFIGKQGDGGHKEAATCKPGDNQLFDADRFGQVKPDNFLAYCQYIAGKVSEFSGLEIKTIKKIGN